MAYALGESNRGRVKYGEKSRKLLRVRPVCRKHGTVVRYIRIVRLEWVHEIKGG